MHYITRVILSGQNVCRDFLLLFEEYFCFLLQGNCKHPRNNFVLESYVLYMWIIYASSLLLTSSPYSNCRLLSIIISRTLWHSSKHVQLGLFLCYLKFLSRRARIKILQLCMIKPQSNALIITQILGKFLDTKENTRPWNTYFM